VCCKSPGDHDGRKTGKLIFLDSDPFSEIPGFFGGVSVLAGVAWIFHNWRMHKIVSTIMALAFASVAGFTSAFADGSWWSSSPWDDPDRGYWWYPPDRPPKIEQEEQEPEPVRKDLDSITTMEELRAEVERRHSEAIMNPTRENVLAFLSAQNYIMDKAAYFADVSRRVIWQNPEVNYTARAPTANFARTSFDIRRRKEEEELFQQLSKTHALVYFGAGNCPVCNDQAPVLKGLSMESGMPILPISLDGAPLHMFPDAKPDNGISWVASEGKGIDKVPSVYLVDRRTQKFLQIGTGTLAVSDLKSRIWVLTQTQPGENF